MFQKQYEPNFHSHSSSNPYTRIYCILWGTMLLDYSSYDEMMSNLTPRYASEIIGVSKLDESHLHGFIIVTLSGITHRFLTKTSEEAQEWMINIRVGLECVFGNKEISEYRPSKITYDYPPCQHNTICPLTSQLIHSSSQHSLSGNSSSTFSHVTATATGAGGGGGAVSSSSNGTICKSCGYLFLNTNQFYSCPILHFNKTDEPLLLCTYCYHAQLLLYTLKQMNYVNLHSLHEHSVEVLFNSNGIYQATSTLRQWTYPSLAKFSEINKNDNSSGTGHSRGNGSSGSGNGSSVRTMMTMTSEDYSSLQQTEMKCQYEIFQSEYQQMRIALQTLGKNIQYIIDFLRNPLLKSTTTATSSSSSSSSSAGSGTWTEGGAG
jgi:hypothetical protein